MSKAKRTDLIVEVFKDAFDPLMKADPKAFRTKYRKMAADPHAFYRGSACLYYADVTGKPDPGSNEQSGAIWIHGDLHVENFGTYLNSDGRLVFDINDFDEAYIGHFTWDLQRFAASLALLGWQKALPEEDIVALIRRYVRAYLSQVDHYASEDEDEDFALHLENTEGPVLEALVSARTIRRADLLDELTHVEDAVRVFTEDATIRHLAKRERAAVEKAFKSYLETIPRSKRFDRELFYDLRDVVGKSGFGIGSAGLPAYNLLGGGLQPGAGQRRGAVDEAGQHPGPEPVRGQRERRTSYFEHEGHRTVVSQRALQVHTDPLLGYAEMDGVGYVISEVVALRGGPGLGEHHRARRHGCRGGPAGPRDREGALRLRRGQRPGPGRRSRWRGAIVASLKGRRRAFTDHIVDFGLRYADTVRRDHALFVDAFRSGRIGVAAT